MRTHKSIATIPIFLILLLLVINGILLHKNQAIKQDRKEVLGLMQEEKIELRAEYDEMIVELESYQVENVQLDEHVVELQQQIEVQKLEIERLLQTAPNDVAALRKARNLMASFRKKVRNYQKETINMKKSNEVLTASTQKLENSISKAMTTIASLELEKQHLSKENQALLAFKDSLLETSQELVADKEDLMEEKKGLEKKIDKAAVLEASEVSGIGVFYKKNEREQETSNCKKAKKLKVCFDVFSNALTKIGEQEILIRLINPDGKVLTRSAVEYGFFHEAGTHKKLRYSLKETIGYDGDAANYCVYWEQKYPFENGLYRVQLYHQNHFIGDGAFSLKKGL